VCTVCQIGYPLTIIVAIIAGLLVWHFTRANQARLGVRSRRGQIKSLHRDIRTFGLRGIVVLVFLLLVLNVALRY
jgi:hypothetical protein